MNTELLMKKAENSIKGLKLNETFVLKDLYDGATWNRLERGERISLGKIFKNAVIEGEFTQIKYINKASNNSAMYQKIK